MTISNGTFEISIDFYYTMEILIFHEILNFPWEINSPMRFKIFLWDFEISYGKTNNPIWENLIFHGNLHLWS